MWQFENVLMEARSRRSAKSPMQTVGGGGKVVCFNRSQLGGFTVFKWCRSDSLNSINGGYVMGNFM